MANFQYLGVMLFSSSFFVFLSRFMPCHRLIETFDQGEMLALFPLLAYFGRPFANEQGGPQLLWPEPTGILRKSRPRSFSRVDKWFSRGERFVIGPDHSVLLLCGIREAWVCNGSRRLNGGENTILNFEGLRCRLLVSGEKIKPKITATRSHIRAAFHPITTWPDNKFINAGLGFQMMNQGRKECLGCIYGGPSHDKLHFVTSEKKCVLIAGIITLLGDDSPYSY